MAKIVFENEYQKIINTVLEKIVMEDSESRLGISKSSDAQFVDCKPLELISINLEAPKKSKAHLRLTIKDNEILTKNKIEIYLLLSNQSWKGRPGGGPAQWWKNNELKDPRVNAINRKYRFKNSAGYRDTFSWIAVSSKIFRMESIEPKELETFIYDTIVTNYIEPFNALVDLFDVVFKKEEVAAE